MVCDEDCFIIDIEDGMAYYQFVEHGKPKVWSCASMKFNAEHWNMLIGV